MQKHAAFTDRFVISNPLASSGVKSSQQSTLNHHSVFRLTANSQQSTVNSQQSTVNSQQSTVNSQQSTVNSQQPTVNSQQSTANSTNLTSYYFGGRGRRKLRGLRI
ncbi:hypothetical protein [Microcoleus sp.]|uniref:hypothetical protein n=1 Tax=Microcoleus sp. TaxID=44472 RepID=UPI00403E6C8C